VIAGHTLNSGYLQFARPASGGYDPICFAMRRPSGNREFPIVRLDHEEIFVMLESAQWRSSLIRSFVYRWSSEERMIKREA